MVPRTDHVVVVGLGQVRLRLCLLLRELGMPVLAIETNPDRDNVARAKNYGVPRGHRPGQQPLPAPAALAAPGARSPR